MRSRLLFLLMAGMAVVPASIVAALADDPESFLAGATRSCIECDLSGRQLADHATSSAPSSTAPIWQPPTSREQSLFRATLTRANLKGAKLGKANLNLIDAKGRTSKAPT